MFKFEMQKGQANACACGFYAVGTVCTIISTVKNVQVANETLRAMRGEPPKTKHKRRKRHSRKHYEKRKVITKPVEVDDENWHDEEIIGDNKVYVEG